jgi:hypothetical protein
LVTGSQVLVLNPGVEIWAPDWVAIALLCTAQPADPRSDKSLAPVSDGELTLMPAVLTDAAVAATALGEADDDGLAWAVDAVHSSAVAKTMTAAQ